MAKIADKWEKADKNRIIELLYLVVLGLYLLKLSFDTTMFYIPWPEDYEVIIFIITCGVVMLKIGYSQKCQGLRWLFCVIIGLVFGLSWWHTEYNYLFLLYIPALIAGAIDVDYKKILKVSFWINFTTLFLAFFGSCVGVISDLSYEAEVGYRHSFGIMYTTDFAARVFYLLVTGWVLFDGLHIIIGLMTTAICTWFIYYYCQGKCSTVTLTLFMVMMVYEYAARSGRMPRKLLIQIVDYLAAWIAPIGAGVILFLSLRYEESAEWVTRIDDILTQRLSLSNKAINEYGFTFLGTAFEQMGAGGSTAYNFFYNFIDSSYILVLLRYGTIVFAIIVMLTVYLSKKALKNNHRKLLLAIMLVAVHSIVEHHMPEVNYNIFLILPFAAVIPMNEKGKVPINSIKRNWKIITVTAAVCGVFLSAAPLMMRYIRTIVHLLEYDKSENHIYFTFWVFLIVASLIVFIYTNVKIFVSKGNIEISISRIIGLAIPIIVMLVVIINSNKILKKGMNEYEITIISEKKMIEKVIDACGQDVNLYVADLPELYKKEIATMSDKLLPIETFDMTDEEIILIIPRERELNSLLQSGYYFGELSDMHGIYTNNKKAISILESMGIKMTDYYSILSEIDMQAAADANDLSMSDDGALLLSGSGESIYHGPWISLSSGRYIIEFDVQLTCADEYEIGKARVTSDSGETWWEGKDITWAYFDENGHGIISFDIDFWCDVDNTEFILIANDGIELMVNRIGYCKIGSIEREEGQ